MKNKNLKLIKNGRPANLFQLFQDPMEKIVLTLIKEKIAAENGLVKFKNKMCSDYKIQPPRNISLLKSYHNLLKNKKIKRNLQIEELLKTSKIRSLSGIVVVSALTKPYPCPGKCLYCPTQKGVPKSYLDNEPAVMRAIQNNFDPYRQTQFRLQGLKDTGHPTDKINIRIIGATWSYYPKKYREWFVARCLAACNEFSRARRNKKAKRKIEQNNLKTEQQKNEKAKCRVVEISIETRPDYINTKEIRHLRTLGVTKVELGAQSIYDNVLKFNRRGHNAQKTIEATKLLKDSGFKVSYQMMLNLPKSNIKRDLKMFQELFNNPNFKPDCLKIYPLAIVKEAPIYKLFRLGKIKPHSTKILINLIKSIKKEIPYYCRIERVIRDIPSPSVVAGGVKISNLRENVLEEMEKEGLKCKCIRYREIKEKYEKTEKVYLFRQDYEASGGKEIFLSFENKERTKLYSLLRLRIPLQKNPALPILKNAAIIREIHTYGQMVPISKNKSAPQHKGLGKKLVAMAEKIIKKEFSESGCKRIIAISGIGARNYWRKLDYRLKDSYMVKKISKNRPCLLARDGFFH